MNHHHKSAAELEREVVAQRERVERSIDEVAARLSPGQLLDEALRYTRHGPAADFASNLGRQVVENPLPIALIGASMVWLTMQPRRQYDPSPDQSEATGDEQAPPIATIRGSYLQRVGVTKQDDGRHISEFTDDGGRKFIAHSDPSGHRMGHFYDEAGTMFRGFTNEAGGRITEFRDEAGHALSDAAGWASHTWRNVTSTAGKTRAKIRDRGERTVEAVDEFLHQQPLVSGAFAFAVGALIAASLPHTRTEDDYLGEAADSIKHGMGRQASKAYSEVKEAAENVHDQLDEAVQHLHQQARQAAADQRESAREQGDPGPEREDA
jgi:ElaB/YqjD/DUF883 family membrane-anchored ribosome-binding protein